MFRKVLIPVDVAVREDSKNLLQTALSLTKVWDCELHVATIVPNVGMAIVGSFFDENFEADSHEVARKELDSLLSGAGLRAQRHVLTGRVYDGIISLANELNVDLILIGAHQPELRDYLLGSNAARVVRHAKQSVLVVRDILGHD